ncbi:MAG: hypothetical protein HUU46_13190 [Candidatus Hydrogenedentes bacterium]|nr:hypothetical protein [Candidatus Hydrogenedentota bacterium]
MAADRNHIREWWRTLLTPDRAGRSISSDAKLDRLDASVLAIVCMMYCCYGISMGMPRGALPAVVSGLKLPLLYVFTLLVCFPPFYVLNNFLGPRLSGIGCLRLLLLATSANSVAIFSYAPVSYFFTLTTSSIALSGYRFLVIMHVAVFAVAGGLSLVIIHVLFRAASHQLNRPLRSSFLVMFGGVYAFVGTQMSWVLRPWIGSWAIDYQPLRPIEGSFIESIFRLTGL